MVRQRLNKFPVEPFLTFKLKPDVDSLGLTVCSTALAAPRRRHADGAVPRQAFVAVPVGLVDEALLEPADLHLLAALVKILLVEVTEVLTAVILARDGVASSPLTGAESAVIYFGLAGAAFR